ncbi:YlzJ-like family protein [Paenibacillus doosanensis]|uniref:YlzJ-like protein n=1 Tax=Paenibacillus konkukensis TaxID=2020716 RepID=A0ABY4RZQ1_9BACL|nr:MULTISPECIES: YlzJ-like family protein [Paenibacillus]MCS7461834.1 YlzJ-like family protein [Paenibacillus doosanensis]UQZ87398.1 hypothetical protein SK3146_06695 [Paenibacillus konkukensis]
MIHYTVMPLDVVMEGIDKLEANHMEIVMNGITMQVQPMNANQAAIVRIISCNPQDYMHPEYAPGRIIEFHPTI